MALNSRILENFEKGCVVSKDVEMTFSAVGPMTAYFGIRT